MVPNRLSELKDPNLESLWFTIRPYRLPREFSIFVFGVTYHPPYPNPDYPMIEHIHKSLDSILQKHPDAAIMLVGDFNMLKAGSIMISYKVKQIVKKPTKGNNTLDKVFTNMANLYKEPVVLPPLGSLPHGNGVVICQPCVVTEGSTNKYIVEVRRNDRNSKVLFTHALQQTSWTDLYKMNSCSEQFHKFQTTIDCLRDTYMPKQLVTR